MSDASLEKITDRLNGFLLKERDALLKGDFETISMLLKEKELLVEELSESAVLGHGDLTAIRERVHYNQELLEGALKGIRAVADRLKHLRRVREGLDTYTRDGRKAGVAQPTRNRLEKRA